MMTTKKSADWITLSHVRIIWSPKWKIKLFCPSIHKTISEWIYDSEKQEIFFPISKEVKKKMEKPIRVYPYYTE